VAKRRTKDLYTVSIKNDKGEVVRSPQVFAKSAGDALDKVVVPKGHTAEVRRCDAVIA
jgi:hypothetical protein